MHETISVIVWVNFWSGLLGSTGFLRELHYCTSKGESPTYILNEDTPQVIYARSKYHTQLAQMSFDEILDLTAGALFYFYNIIGLSCV